MSLMDDLRAAIAPGQPFPTSNLDDIFDKWDKKYREQGLLPTGFETLEYEVGRMGNRQTKTIQVPIYKEAQQAATDLYIEEQIAEGKLKRVGDEDEDDVPEAKIYEGDYVSKFAEGGEGYINPYLDEQEALKNIPKDFPGQDVLQGFADLKSTPIPELQINPAVSAPVTEALPVNTTYNNSAAINNIVGGLSSVIAPPKKVGPPLNPTTIAAMSDSGAAGAADQPYLGASYNFPAINKPPTNTKAVTPAPIAGPITIPGTEYQSKYDPAAADKLIAEYKANQAKEALLNPPPIPEPYDGLNKTYPPQTSSSGYNFGLPSNFGVMGTPDAQPPAVQPPATQPPAVQPPPTTPTETGSQGGGLTPEQEQFMQTVKGLEKSARQRAAAERVTRQNMARAGQTADIRLGIQNGRAASGLDAFKRRFKIGQQSPSTNLMINA